MADHFHVLDETAAGSSVTAVRATISSGDLTFPDTSGSWALWNSIPELTLAASADDIAEVSGFFLRAGSSSYIDPVFVTGAGPTIARYLTTGTTTAPVEGAPGWYPDAAYITASGPRTFVVTAGDLDAGMLRMRMACKGNGLGTLYAGANYAFFWQLKVYST